jgi:hypothetical protein
MNALKQIRTWVILCGLVLVFLPLQGLTQQSSDTSKTSAQPTPERDGSHDFDPLLGSWKYHLKRRMNPLAGSNTWVEFDGTGVCRKVYDGAEIDQILVDGPAGHPICSASPICIPNPRFPCRPLRPKLSARRRKTLLGSQT